MFLAISIASFNLFNLVSTLSVIFLIKIFILKIRRVLLADIVLSQIRINRLGEKARQGISSTTLRLQTFRLQTFRLLLYSRVKDSYTSNFCFGKSLFSSIPTSTYTMIPFINPTDTMIIQHI